jgi:hypothetical protein
MDKKLERTLQKKTFKTITHTDAHAGRHETNNKGE